MTELVKVLPALNAGLILTSGVFLLTGFYFIRRQRDVRNHRRSMITATVFAALFLVVYVTRTLLFGGKLFGGSGWIRVAYLGILGSHTVLAALVGPMALVTLYFALKQDFRRHRRIARITLPTWLYVAATGWIIYWMLYHLTQPR
jgi:putative membrane protein